MGAETPSSGVAAGIADRIRAWGPVLNPEVVADSRAFYTARLGGSSPDIVETPDIAYGEDGRQRLDVYRPRTSDAAPLPVVIFFHGGGFNGGNKADATGFFQNVASSFARHGLIAVAMTYRLAPAFQWPSGSLDVAAALAWTRRSIADHGGDPERIVIFGQSAGATHVAQYLYDDRHRPTGGDGAVGAILMSGVYDPTGFDSPAIESYFGTDRSRQAERSVFAWMSRRAIPTFVVAAEFDPPPFLADAARLRAALTTRDGVALRYRVVPGHNHATLVLQFESGDDSIGPALVEFVRAVAR